MSVPEWVLTTLIPSIAIVITTAMWLSPLKAVLAARKSRELGDTNPYPYVATILNCIGYTSYGLMKKDEFLFWSNVTGLVLGLFYLINTMTIIAGKTKPYEELSDQYKTLEYLLLFAFSFWPIILLISQFGFSGFPDPQEQAMSLVGTISMMFSIAYYAAPCATMLEVIKKRDSASLYAPMITLNLVNSLLWSSYGLALLDPNIAAPNCIGVVLAVLQLTLSVMFKRKEATVIVEIEFREKKDGAQHQ
jgi:solute carrier family 50 protein (sugar transporter)